MNTTKVAGRDLHEIIDQRLTSLIHEMEAADWTTKDVVLAIDSIVRSRWLARLDSLQEARSAMPDDFVSDGNEG